jgi:O-antigen/teichoic acid export membrane protein
MLGTPRKTPTAIRRARNPTSEVCFTRTSCHYEQGTWSEAINSADVNQAVLRNILSNYAGKIVTLGVWFVLTPFILAQLGDAVFGLWVLVGSIAGYGGLFDLGIAGAVVKYTAEYHAKGADEEGSRVIATALCVYAILGLIVFGFAVALAPSFPDLFNVPVGQRATAVTLVWLSGLGIGLSLPLGTAAAVLRGLQRFDLVNLLTSISTLLYASSTVVVLLSGGGVLGLVIVGIVVNLIMQIPSLWLIHRVAPDLLVGSRGVSLRMARVVFGFSSTLFFLNLNGYLETKTDEIVIGAALPLSAVTPYNLARKLGMLPQMLTEQFLSLILPLASVLDAKNDAVQLRALYIASTRVTLGLVLPLSVILAVAADSILALWVGSSYAKYAYLVVLFAIVSVIDTSQWPAGLVLQGMARHRWLALGSLASGITNLVLSLALVHGYELTGVAIGTLIPTTIVCLGFVLPYAMKALGVSPSVVFRQMFAPAIFPLVPMLIAIAMMKASLGTNSFLSLTAVSSAGLVIYGLGYASIGVNSVETHALRNVAVRALRCAKMRLTFS